jgi:hypothetical protein
VGGIDGEEMIAGDPEDVFGDEGTDKGDWGGVRKADCSGEGAILAMGSSATPSRVVCKDR